MNSISRNGIDIHKGVTCLKVHIDNFDSSGVVYRVEGTPICQWDQHARARIGAKFSDYNVSNEAQYAIYTSVFKMMETDTMFCNRAIRALVNIEIARSTAKQKAEFNLMSRICSYKVEQTWESLRGQMFRRLKFCEEEFIVGLHWLLRSELLQKSQKPLTHWEDLKKFLPGCDLKEECDYSTDYYLSNMFGCLFAPCGRWPAGTDYATFNKSCTNLKDLEEQLNLVIPEAFNE
jgi:hypothetical protein